MLELKSFSLNYISKETRSSNLTKLMPIVSFALFFLIVPSTRLRCLLVFLCVCVCVSAFHACIHAYITRPCDFSGGFIHLRAGANTQYATGTSFLLSVYGDLLDRHNQKISCGSHKHFVSHHLLDFAKKQVNMHCHIYYNIYATNFIRSLIIE